jgi:hypothetical protein
VLQRDYDQEDMKQIRFDHEDAKPVLKVQPPSGKAYHALRLMPPNGVDRSSINPLVLLVDVSSGKDDPGCGRAAGSQCASISYALAQGQQQPPDQGLEVRVQPGDYPNECSPNGNEVTSPTSTTIKRADGATAAVTIDCAGSGKFLNITQGPASVSTLEGLSIMGGSSQSSGGAVAVDGGSLVLGGCAFVDCECLASTADGFFEGGGAVAMSRAVSLRLEGGTFTNCRAPNGAGGAIKVDFEDKLAKEAMGEEWWRSAAAGAETMGLLQSRFDRCSAGTQGGAVAVQVGTWTSSISTLVEDTSFERSRLSAAGTRTSVEGGSLSVTFTDEMQDVTNTIRRTNMTDGLLVSGSGSIFGGGAYWYYQQAVMNVHTLVTASILRNMTLISEGGWSAGGGFMVKTAAEMTNVTTTIEDSTISGNVLQSKGLVAVRGGSVNLEHRGGASSVAVAVKSSVMENNFLAVIEGTGQPAGAGLSMMMFDEATGVSTTIEDSTISSHKLQCAGGFILGGSVYLYHNLRALSVAVAVRQSFMKGNSLTVEGSGQVRGAGLCMYMFGEATNVSTTIEDSTISSHTLQSLGDRNYGGSVYLWCGGGTAGNVMMAFRNSIFEDNRGCHYGGAVVIYMQTSFRHTGFVRTVFSDCRLRNNTASYQGGAIWHQMLHAGASLELHRCILLDNYAGEDGGGVYARQIAANLPTNLEMYTTDHGPTSFPRYTWSALYDWDYAREWDYGPSTLFIDASTISNNSAGDEAATDTVSTGGGIFVQNLNTTVRACEVTDNRVAGNGGAFYLDGGSARLSVEGNTSITRSAATQAGSAIYSVSGGGITLSGTTTIDFIRDAAAAGIEVLSGGQLEHGANTLMQCPAGEQMLYNVSTDSTTFNGWSIDCNQVRSLDNGSQINYVNPTCAQIQDGPSPLNTLVCGGMPILPSMLSSSGTISCSPCPNNQYSLDHGRKQGDGSVRGIRCLDCPYGATCVQGGARVQVKPGFWGMAGLEDEPTPPIPAPTPAPTIGQTHYSNPAQGCLPSEATMEVSGVPGDFCAPDCTSTACPTGVPAGVTADPECIVEGAGNEKSCALICNPAAANACGSAQCQPIQGTGVCTYKTADFGRKGRTHLAKGRVSIGSKHPLAHTHAESTIADLAVRTPVWLSYQCPDGYCCIPGPNADSCDIDGDGILDKMCVGNRDPAAPLCGGCLAGHSQAINSLNCVPDIECSSTSAGVYAFSQLVYWIVYDVYVLVQAKYMPLLLRLQWLPEKIRPGTMFITPDNGATNVVMFFFQLAQVAVPDGQDNLAAGVYRTLGELFSVQHFPHSPAGGTCMQKGDTMTSILAWQLFSPLMPVVTLLLIGALAFAVSQQIKNRRDSDDADAETGPSEPFLSDDEALLKGGNGAANKHAANNRSFASAVAGLCLLGYASLTQAALKLLRCTSIDGHRVLFYAGQTACPSHYAHWQAVIMLLFMVSILLPLVPACVWVLCRLPSSWRVTKWAWNQQWPQQLMMRALKDNATEPFRSEHWHFTALLALQRLVTMMCRTFATQAIEASLSVTMVSTVFLILQMVARPYRIGWVNTLQLIASFSLVLLSMFETVFSAFVSATYTIEGSPLEAMGHRISYLMALLLLPAPLYLLHGMLVRQDEPQWDPVNEAVGERGRADGGANGRRMGWGEEENEAAGGDDVTLVHVNRRAHVETE